MLLRVRLKYDADGLLKKSPRVDRNYCGMYTPLSTSPPIPLLYLYEFAVFRSVSSWKIVEYLVFHYSLASNLVFYYFFHALTISFSRICGECCLY